MTDNMIQKIVLVILSMFVGFLIGCLISNINKPNQ